VAAGWTGRQIPTLEKLEWLSCRRRPKQDNC